MGLGCFIAVAVLLVSCGGGRASGGFGGGGAGSPGTGGAAGSAGEAGAAGSAGAGAERTDAGDRADAGFAADFASRARAALASSAPPWTCATALPTIPVADAAAARDAIRQFVAQVVGVPAADITLNVQLCGTAISGTDCATAFAHDTAKSGGSIYDTADPLARELEANATDIEDTIWTPMQDGMALPGDAVMSGIAGGLLVGMVVFNAPYACQ